MLDDTFCVVAYGAPDPRALASALGGRARIRVVDADEARPALLYQDLASTRGVQVTWGDDLARVRLRPFCSEEDQALAVDVLRALRQGEDSGVTHDGEVVPWDALAARVGRVSDALAAYVLEDLGPRLEAGGEQAWRFEGPIRPFVLGPRLWATLRAEAPREGLGPRIVERMRRVQYADRDLSVTLAPRRVIRSGDDAALRVATLRPDARSFVPSCELVGVADEDGTELLLPPAVLAALLGAGCVALDELQLLVEPLRGPRRRAFLRHARALTVGAAAPSGRDVDGLGERVARARLLCVELALVEQGPPEPGDRLLSAQALDDRISRLEAARKAGSLQPEELEELADAYRELGRLALEGDRFEEEATALARRLHVVAGQVWAGGAHPTRLANAHADVAGAEERCGRALDALQHLDVALRLLEGAPADGSGVTANCLLSARLQRADLLVRLGRDVEAGAELDAACARAGADAVAQLVGRAQLTLAGVRRRTGAGREAVLEALGKAVRALRPAVDRGEALELFVDVVDALERCADDAGALPLIVDAASPALALLEAGRTPAGPLLSLVASRAKALWGGGDIVGGLAELERGCVAAAEKDLPVDETCEADFALADILRDRDELERALARIDGVIARAAASARGELLVPYLRMNRLLTCLAGADLEGALVERHLICLAEGRARLGGLLFGGAALADAGRAAEAVASLEEASALLGDEDSMRGEGLRAELRLARARARLALGDRAGAAADAASGLATFDAHLARGIHLGELPRLEALVVLGAVGDGGALARAITDGERASDRLPRALDCAVEASLWQAARGEGAPSAPRIDRVLVRPAGAARLLLALERLVATRDGPGVEEVLAQALARLSGAAGPSTPAARARWTRLRPRAAATARQEVLEALDRRFDPSRIQG